MELQTVSQAYLKCFAKGANNESTHQENWQSGLMRLPAKELYQFMVSVVRIYYFPPGIRF